MDKKKKSLPAKDRLNQTNKGVLLVQTANRIIENDFDPVKLIGDLIQYHRLTAQMYRESVRRK